MRNRRDEHDRLLTRRQILQGAAGLGLAAATGTILPGCSKEVGGGEKAGAQEADGPPETTSIRLWSVPNVQCIAAQYMAEPFLREEGFTDIQYPRIAPKEVVGDGPTGLGSLNLDFGVGYSAAWIPMIDRGVPLVMLGGVHLGCWQVFATGAIRSLRDFKNKTVSITNAAFTDGIFMALTLNEVGLDLRKDVRIVNYPPTDNVRVLSSGEVDAVVAFPPINKDLQVKGIGRVVLDSITDPPWSNYYCCTAVTTRQWIEKHPMATKRALRAIVKGADTVAKDPDASARFMVDRGYSDNFDYTCDILREIPYKNIWRDMDPVDSARFYALRLKRAGLIRSTPERILKRGTDFRHLYELRRELKEA